MAYPAPPHAYPYAQPQYQPRPKNGMGTAALVLGILALLASFIPLLSLFTAVPLGLLGVIFAIVGYGRLSKGNATNKASTTVGLILSAIAVIIAVVLTLLVGAWLGSDSDSGTTGGSTNAASSSDDDNDDQDDAAPEKRFSGQQDSDVVGEPGETLQARGVTVTAEPLNLESVSYADPVLCSHVTYENNTDDRLDYNEWDWSLQSPSGDIKDITIFGVDDRLRSGDLAPEGTTSGHVCFDNTGETGEHVLLFEGFITFDSSRAAWINDME